MINLEIIYSALLSGIVEKLNEKEIIITEYVNYRPEKLSDIDYSGEDMVSMEVIDLDKREFIIRVYHSNGSLKFYDPYLNNINHGIFKEYFNDGPISCEYEMKNNVMDGKNTEYDLDGSVIVIRHFHKGRLIG